MAWRMFRRKRSEDELDEEIRTHLAIETEQRVERGEPRDEAAAGARRDFGNVLLVKEATRDSWSGTRLWNSIGRDLTIDLRYTVRGLLRIKGWSIVAVLTLALGIGPLTAVFSLCARFFEKLPVTNPDELVAFPDATFSPADYEILRSVNQTLTDLFAVKGFQNPREIIVNGQLDQTRIQYVSGNYFQALKLSPAIGRMILPEDDKVSAAPVAVISYRYWQKMFDKSPAALGASLTLNRKPITIVGVLPENFTDVSGRPKLGYDWDSPVVLPLAQADPQHPELSLMGRLKPRVTVEQAQANFEHALDLDPRNPNPLRLESASRGPQGGFRVFRLYQGNARIGTRQLSIRMLATYLLIFGFFSIPLILSCSNIATFLLSRSEDRRTEIAVRTALGAGRNRIMRQLLTESVLLGAMGAVAGLIVAYGWTKMFANPPFSTYGDLSIEWTAFVFVLILSLPIGIACGLIPARASAGNIQHVMASGAPQLTRYHSESMRTLMALQVAISVLGLIAVGLMLRSIRTMRSIDPGFNTTNVAAFTLNPQAGSAELDAAGSAALLEHLIEQISTVSGVRSVSYADQMPLSANSKANIIFGSGKNDAGFRQANWVNAQPAFFSTLSIPIKLGRPFNDSDSSFPQKVVVNEAFARAFFPNQSAIGERFGKAYNNRDAYEIVGVAGDTRIAGLTTDTMPPTVFAPVSCCPAGPKVFLVRTSSEASAMLPALRSALLGMTATVPITIPATLQSRIDSYSEGSRTMMFILGYYAGLSTVLVLTGLFGLMSQTVSRRTREIGIRMAVGASSRDLAGGILREGIMMVLPGIGIGLLTAFSLHQIFSSLISGIEPYHPWIIASAVIALFVIAGVAAYVPTRRALHIDPAVALRHD